MQLTAPRHETWTRGDNYMEELCPFELDNHELFVALASETQKGGSWRKETVARFGSSGKRGPVVVAQKHNPSMRADYC